MRIHLIILVAILSSLSGQLYAQEGVDYRNDEFQLTFEIPGGWSQVSEMAITKRRNEIQEETGLQVPSPLQAVFKRVENPDFSPPYVTLNIYQHYGAMDSEKFREKYGPNSRTQLLRGFSGEVVRQGIIRNLKADDRICDEENHVCLIRGRVEREGAGILESVMAVILGSRGLVSIAFIDNQMSYDKNVIAFEKMLGTFRFDREVAYGQQVEVGSNGKMPWWKRDLIKVAAWLPIIGVLWLLGVLFGRKKRK